MLQDFVINKNRSG